MGEETVQRLGDPGEVEGVHQHPRVPVLAAAGGAEEAPELLLKGPAPLGRLTLEGAERPELPLPLDQLLHRGWAEAADQLVLQVGHAHVEPERRHLGAVEVGAEPGPLQAAPEVVLLPGVAQAGQAEVQPLGAVQLQEPPDVPGAAHGDDADALGGEVPAPACGQDLKHDLVAGPFHEHDRPRLDGGGPTTLLVVHLAQCTR
jgi:hypothetical protein